jgi:DnaK suppressor protein
MAKLKKKTAKPSISKSAKAKKPVKAKKALKRPAAKKIAAKVKRVVGRQAKPAKRVAKPASRRPVAARKASSPKRTVAKKSVKPAARKSPVKKIVRKIAPSKVIAKKTSPRSRAGSKIAIGVVAAAAGAAAIKVATSKRSGSSQKPVMPAVRNSIMQNNSKNNNLPKKEVAPGGGIVQPATKSTPAMRLTANDAEILASARERYSTKDLNTFRELLIEQRQEAKEEFDILSQNILDTSGEFEADNQTYSLHTAEQGTDAIEREKTFLHAQRTSDYIKKLDEALERIDRGTYGICVICGGLIEKQRLQAVPITQKHVDCKNRTNARKPSGEQAFHDFEDPVTSAE